jgi:DNA-nicking Smr family endonuclease
VSRRPPDRDPARGGFAELRDEVRPLAGRAELRPPPAPPAAPPRAGSREPRRFALEEAGTAGRAEDVSRKILAKLRAGAFPPEREIDLHGLAAHEAERRLVRAVRDAWRAGQRCLLAIHGRGVHSESRAVLKALLPGWLVSPPLADLVQAWAAAPTALGGAGATLVLLRRARAVSSAAVRGGEPDE